MKQSDGRVKDVVCGMMVDPGDHAVEFQHMAFAFCSSQCKERFLANPHLYIGVPGHKAPGQEGVEVIKRRRLHLSRPLGPDGARQVEEALRAMMGIRALQVGGDTIEITYDLLQATLKQIEDRLVETGVRLGNGWAERLRRALLQESEELQIESLEVTSSKHQH